MIGGVLFLEGGLQTFYSTSMAFTNAPLPAHLRGLPSRSNRGVYTVYCLARKNGCQLLKPEERGSIANLTPSPSSPSHSQFIPLGFLGVSSPSIDGRLSHVHLQGRHFCSDVGRLHDHG